MSGTSNGTIDNAQPATYAPGRWNASSVGQRPTELREQSSIGPGCGLRVDAILQGLGPRALGGSTLRLTELIEAIGEEIMRLEVIRLQARRFL